MSATLKQKNEMENLIKNLNYHTKLYDEGKPIISDAEWDTMYYKLVELERETGEILYNSPSHSISFEVVNELKKVEHNHPMLSLDKTKDLEVVKSFLNDKDWIAMAKMDGLTCSLRYVNGELISAETRGNGIKGEDITHNALVIPSIPNHINFKDELIIDGEVICTYNDFKPFEETYKNPRNFSAGSIRLLDSKECYKRNLTFVAWDIINGDKYLTLTDKLQFLNLLNFIIVPYINSSEHTVEDAVTLIQNSCKELYPIDGIVFKYDNIEEYNKAGRTDHHFKGGMAFKFYDETYSTQLRYIQWTMGRTGVLTPVAVFDPVEIDGTEISRASLHNVSIMHELLGNCAYVGEKLEIYKANQIIPQIYSAGPKYDYGYIISHGGAPANDVIEYCPICGYPVTYKEENGIIRAYCENLTCSGKLINILDHFCGKKGLDIKGLSKATLEKLIDWGWVHSIRDIFDLDTMRDQWIKKPGFGTASVDKILKAIKESSSCTLSKYLCALGIPLIGKVASDSLEKEFKTYGCFRQAIDDKDEKLYNINGIGEVMIQNLLNFNYTDADFINDVYINEISTPTSSSNENELKEKIFVITGKLNNYKNRDELKSFIESKGGKVTGSVTKKTSYLINNDINSETSKNVTAKKLGVPIITEEEFQDLIKLC